MRSKLTAPGSCLEVDDVEIHGKAGARVLESVGLITHGLPSNEADGALLTAPRM